MLFTMNMFVRDINDFIQKYRNDLQKVHIENTGHNQPGTERWKLDLYCRIGDMQEGSWRWAFGIKVCIDDTDGKSSACQLHIFL